MIQEPEAHSQLEGLCWSMSKKIYIGVGDLAKEVDPLYISVGGSTKKVSKVYVGIDGVARQAYPNTITYKWNRYNVNTTYYWDRYNVKRTYKWNRYTTKTVYIWDKYNATNTLDYTSEQVDCIRHIGVSGEAGTSFKLVMDGDSPALQIENISSRANLDGTRYVSDISVAPYGYDDPRYPPMWYQIVIYDYVADSGPQPYIYKCTPTIYGGYSAVDVFKMVATGGVNKGSYVGEITSSSSSTYPDDGVEGNYWYIYDRSEKQKGSSSGTVTSSSSGSYPSNGASGSYWYVYAGSTTSKGTANGSVSSTSSGSYPNNGVSGSYWYVYDRSTQAQGSANGSVTSTNRSQYPDNGVSGSYWYVYAGTV